MSIVSKFPTFSIEGVTLPRVICGTNALFGWSHVSEGRNAWLRRYYTPERVARVFATCMELGATAVMGPLHPPLVEALEETEKLTGQRPLWLSTTAAPPGPDSTPDQVRQIREAGAPICSIHGAWVDKWVLEDWEALERCISQIREADLVPAAVCHYSDRLAKLAESGVDLPLLGTPVNKTGWWMCPDQESALGVLRRLGRPLLAIKPLACGRFEEGQLRDWLEWAVDREGVDAVAIGPMCEDEAQESIPILCDLLSQKFG
jgi:hypothetical protein